MKKIHAMASKPSIDDARTVKRIPLATGTHTGVLLSDITSSSSTKYEYILVVRNDATGDPCLYVASEVNAMAEFIHGPNTSHYFCLFIPGQGHINLGMSDDWADLEKFEKKAVEVAEQLLSGHPITHFP